MKWWEIGCFPGFHLSTHPFFRNMLLSFRVDNWMSFRDEAQFSLVATRERQHQERLVRLDRYGVRVLPISVIYGGNASGKTNFFKALNFARQLVVRGTRPDAPIPVERFRLSGAATAASHFSFEILAPTDELYEFSFAVNHREVLFERLVLINGTSEHSLYERQGGSIKFGDRLEKDSFLRFAFQGTRPNQLFLTNAVSQNVKRFAPVYDWFKHVLDLVAPDVRFDWFEQFMDVDSPLYQKMNDWLPTLDTGMQRLAGEKVPFESVSLPDEIRRMVIDDLEEGDSVRVVSGRNERFVFTRRHGEIQANKLYSYHMAEGGEQVRFELYQESDGSQRVLDLLPVFLTLAEPGRRKVFVVDEVDRSLHTLLTRRLLETYLAGCNAGHRSQLLLTTHDMLLMDQTLLRRDEMWAAERGPEGVSRLIPFSDFKNVRYDKDVRKSYLQGRLGGTPNLSLSREHMWARGPEHEAEPV